MLMRIVKFMAGPETPSVTAAVGRPLPAGRKAELAEYVATAGQVTVPELVKYFDVSADTIRRDLDRLDEKGLLIRTHGGAMSLSAAPRVDTTMDVRLRLQAEAKEKMGALASTLVHDNSVLMINAGTTALAVVRNLRGRRGITIATNNLRIPSEVAAGAIRSLYVFGGSVNLTAQATIGPVAFPSASGADGLEIQCDLAIIVVGGVSVTSGYSTSNLHEAAMMSEMLNRASRVAIVADSTKVGRRLFAQVAELGRADYFVSDVAPPSDLARELEKQKVKLMVPSEL
ncbi:MAG: DeoR family fructose operon transcriptional repressor [Pontimonas sp.]|jgi:DeoR family fructose operon transcriptional repressor